MKHSTMHAAGAAAGALVTSERGGKTVKRRCGSATTIIISISNSIGISVITIIP